MAMAQPEVEIPVKTAPDRSAMQARTEQVYQEKEIPQPVLPKPIPVVEQPKPVVEPPKPPVLHVTALADFLRLIVFRYWQSGIDGQTTTYLKPYHQQQLTQTPYVVVANTSFNTK